MLYTLITCLCFYFLTVISSWLYEINKSQRNKNTAVNVTYFSITKEDILRHSQINWDTSRRSTNDKQENTRSCDFVPAHSCSPDHRLFLGPQSLRAKVSCVYPKGARAGPPAERPHAAPAAPTWCPTLAGCDAAGLGWLWRPVHTLVTNDK